METGREAEARAEAKKFLEQNPNYSVKKYINRLKRSYKNPKVLDRPFDLMCKAGLHLEPLLGHRVAPFRRAAGLEFHVAEEGVFIEAEWVHSRPR